LEPGLDSGHLLLMLTSHFGFEKELQARNVKNNSKDDSRERKQKSKHITEGLDGSDQERQRQTKLQQPKDGLLPGREPIDESYMTHSLEDTQIIVERNCQK